MNSAQAVLDKGTLLMEECGKAVASWFGALSGPSLEAAIKESFDKFDTNKSGLLDQQEFERAMYTLGLRLNADKYCEIFQKCDEDRSGDVDIHEFMHMIKCLLKKSCSSTGQHAAGICCSKVDSGIVYPRNPRRTGQESACGIPSEVGRR
jgi:hypothetical protein